LSSTRQERKPTRERQVEEALGKAVQDFFKSFGIGSQLLEIVADVRTLRDRASEADLPSNIDSEFSKYPC
jgi:hypothetical protein